MGDLRRKSRKRSSSKKPKRLKGFTLYLCHNIDYDEVANELNKAGIRFKRHREYFDGSTVDTVLLQKVGRHRWILITADQKQRTRLLEKELIKRHKIREFVFTSSQICNIGEVLVKARRKMRNMCTNNEGPFVASISHSGDVKLRTLN